ncbi:MAG: methyltransferase domain-containing protein [Gammaproteobacteria bacterium]|nr:methyltransferase domain-containing protein [Gammaproteobacteria bacterium]
MTLTLQSGRRLLPALLALVALAACSTSASMSPADEAKMAAALAGEHRSPANRARDEWRHPAETLAFFGVTSDSTVMEIWPGGGWYTEVLAPFLRGSGEYIAAGWDPESDMAFIQNAVAAYNAKLAANPEVYDQVKVAVLMPPMKLAPVPPNSVDVVVTFRNIHNWMPRESQGLMMQAMYDALKPGGVLGVVEHRGDPSVPQDLKAKSGYVNEAYAIEIAEAAGFRFVGKSEVNANPADTKDHPEGVWTLPPTLRLKDQDRDKYLAIGESDRFTLKFVKPEA